MTTLVPPTERVCERCGRRDVWDEDKETWVAADSENESELGNPHCVHEWDINGTFNPFAEE